MGFHNIEKSNRVYSFLKRTLVDFTHNRIFYSRVFVINRENIPADAHLIFTPNHQNALMDALALLCNIDQQLVFMARSDIFRHPVVAAVLYFMKILPVYRIRDGFGSVKKNKGIFKKTIDVIKSKSGLVILPEGNHVGKRRLRPLKKGFARIAFQTEEAAGFLLDTSVVPVGLHYSNYQNARSELYLNFGEPIRVANYYELYKKTPVLAINKLTKDLSVALRPLMVDIRSEENYRIHDFIRMHYWRAACAVKPCSGELRLKAEQKVVSISEAYEKQDPAGFEQLKALIDRIGARISAHNIHFEDINRKSLFRSLFFRMVAVLPGIPLFLTGLLFNIFPFMFVKIILHNRIKDPQFKSSIKYVLSLVAFPLFYLLQGIVIQLFNNDIPVTVFILAIMPISGFCAYSLYQELRKISKQIALSFFRRKNPSVNAALQNDKYALDQIIKHIVEQG